MYKTFAVAAQEAEKLTNKRCQKKFETPCKILDLVTKMNTVQILFNSILGI